MTVPRRIVTGALAVLLPYAASFGILWVRTRSIAPPRATLSTKEVDILDWAQDILTRNLDTAEKEMTRTSSAVTNLGRDVKDLSEPWYGNAGDEILSSAQLTLNNQRRLVDVQKMVIGELKLCDQTIKGLRQPISRRILMDTIREIDEWAPKIQETIDETGRGIVKTKLGLRIDPKTLPEPLGYEWNRLMLANMEQEATLTDLKSLHSDATKAAEPLKRLVERTPIIYQTLRFPF
jgi:hypothetical protein